MGRNVVRHWSNQELLDEIRRLAGTSGKYGEYGKGFADKVAAEIRRRKAAGTMKQSAGHLVSKKRRRSVFEFF